MSELPITAITVKVRTAAAHMGLSLQEVGRMCNTGEILSVRIGGVRLLMAQAVREWKRRNSPEPVPRSIANARRRSVYEEGDVVYFVEAATVQLIKIGTTNNLEMRLRGLVTHSPVPLRVMGCIPGGLAAERRLHKRFARHRSHGEWFRVTTHLRSAIEKLLAERGIKPKAQNV